MATPKPVSAAQPTGLKDLLEALEPAVLAVQTCELRVKQLRETNKSTIAAAARVRDAAIRDADVARKAAEATFQQAAARAAQAYAGAVEKAQTALEDAERRFTEACAVADPLLQTLQEKTYRVSSVVNSESARPWER